MQIPRMKPWYLITLPELQRLMFKKVDSKSFGLITRKDFISHFNKLPSRTRTMYLRKVVESMNKKGVQMDCCTGLKCNASIHHDTKRLSSIQTAKKVSKIDGELVLNAAFNWTDSEEMAVIEHDKFGQMLNEFTFNETVAIAKGLGVDVPVAHIDIMVGTYHSDLPNGIVDLDDKMIVGSQAKPKGKAKVSKPKGLKPKSKSPAKKGKKASKRKPAVKKSKPKKKTAKKKPSRKKSNPGPKSSPKKSL